MREIALNFMGPVRRPAGMGSAARLAVEADATVESLLAGLGYEAGERARLRVLTQGRPLGLREPLGEAEEFTIFLPLGGG